MSTIPHTRSFDATLGLLREGYLFIGNRCRRYGSDVFETRLSLQPTICMLGPEVAALFYDEKHFTRHNAAPPRLRHTLLGTGGVQGLDGEAHRHRKRMFLSLMGQIQAHALAERVEMEWERAARGWIPQGEVSLLDESMRLLCRAACAWAGVPLPEEQVEPLTQDLAAMIDGGGGIGPRYLRGRLGRRRGDRWAAEIVRRQRKGEIQAPPGTALSVIAEHQDESGQLLSEQVAAVELINVIRPTVAVARFFVFAAMALHQHREAAFFTRQSPQHARAFIQEVRRFYPFFPFAAARVRETFEWQGMRFDSGKRALLDLYGTNHDPRHWLEPHVFRPARFLGRVERPFDFIPQGGGDRAQHHRCAGEILTTTLMEVAVAFLLRRMQYHVPPQDLSLDLARMPALPTSGFCMRVIAVA